MLYVQIKNYVSDVDCNMLYVQIKKYVSDVDCNMYR